MSGKRQLLTTGDYQIHASELATAGLLPHPPPVVRSGPPLLLGCQLPRSPSVGSAGDMDSVTSMKAINKKIMAMDMTWVEIRTVDSFGGGVTVLMTGHLIGDDGVHREFSQSFFLAPQEKGYFVLNDMFHYVGEGPAFAIPKVQLEADAIVPLEAAPGQWHG